MPSLIVFSLFIFYPLFKSIYLSLYASDPFGLGNTPFVGFKQYEIALKSQSYRDGLGVTILYTLYTVPLGILIALGLAVLANLRVRGIGFFRTVYALPIGVSVGAASIVFLLLYNSRAGVLNYFLTSLGLPAIEWLTEPRAALWAIAILSIWAGIGFNFIVLLSGLQGIPEELYESARIDGANNLRIFRSVTLPMLMPTLFFVLIVSTINAFQSFAQIHILTQGFIRIGGTQHYLWRAVDQDGNVLDILVQRRRDKAAAKKFFRRLLKGLQYVPRVVITDKLASYGAARREVLPSVEHRQHRRLNNRAENSHQPTRERERRMRRFKSPGHAQRFLAAYGPIIGHFRPRRHRLTAAAYRETRTARFATWRAVTGVAAAA